MSGLAVIRNYIKILDVTISDKIASIDELELNNENQFDISNLLGHIEGLKKAKELLQDTITNDEVLKNEGRRRT